MTPAELYNLCCVSLHAPKKFKALFDLSGKKPMTISSSSPPSFSQTELQRALKEQAFGIKNFSLVSASGEQAIANIVLLEGRKITVHLTPRGYSIAGVTTVVVHETVEDLLQSTSPLYARKRQEVLMAKLASLS